MGFPLVGLGIGAKDSMVEVIRPELKILVLVSAVRCFLLRNQLHTKILCRFIDFNCVIF